MLFSGVKISYFRAKAHLVFHWCLYNKTYYYCDHYLPSHAAKSLQLILEMGNLQIGADKGWAVKRARPSKKVWTGIKLWTTCTDQRDREYQGSLRKKSYEFKGFR